MDKNNLKQIRLSCALTQKQVSEVLGIERSTYTCYETGKSTPPIDTAKKLSKIFGVTLEEIFFDEQERKDSSILGDSFSDYNTDDESEMSFAQLTKEEKELIIRFRLLNNDDKKKLLDETDLLSGGLSEQ